MLRDAMRSLFRGSELARLGNQAEAALARARVATLASKRAPDDARTTFELAEANASVVAAMSMDCAEDFPSEVAPESLLWVSNLAAALGRLHQQRSEPEVGLDFHMLALDYLRMKRLYASTPAPEEAVYWVAARAMSAAAETAAARRLTISELLTAIDENIVHQLEASLSRGGLERPRAWAVLGLLRAALVEGDSEYLVRLRDELRGNITGLTDDPRLKANFAAWLDQVSVHLGERTRGGFRW